jgi:putative transposase
MVDTNGLVLGVFVSAADLDEREGAKSLLTNVSSRFPLLSKIWADSGYQGCFIDWVKTQFGIEVEIIKRTDDLRGFKIVPRRWVVERTFGWFGCFKRLSKDYELLPEHSESIIYLAMMRIMLNRLTT